MSRLSVMVEGQEGVAWEHWTTLAETVERLGFDGLFTSDHYMPLLAGGPQRDALDVWAVLSALAACTERIRLGTMVSPVTYRPPAVLAKLALTVDHVSGGRVEVGMGAGWHEREHAAFGFAFPPLGVRLAMLEEQATILRALFDHGEVDHVGEHYRLDRCTVRPGPVQARLPITLGGSAKPRAARLAARVADEYNLVFETPDDCRAANERLDRACEAADRDPTTLRRSLMTRCVIGHDRAEYEARMRRVAELTGEDALAVEGTEGRAWIIGTPQQALERIGEYRAAGVERFMLQHLDHTDLDMLELVAAEVMPEVA
jgi:F420-dependent oxidoreductase-like protein